MATFKMTWFFTDTVDNIGWTENWWVTASDGPAALALVTNYLPKRKAIMLDTSLISAVRAANVDVPRDSSYNIPAGTTGTILAGTYPSAGVWDCLLCRRDITSNNLLGHMFMHQVPANIFLGRVYNPIGGVAESWAVLFSNFVTEVLTGVYLLRKTVAPLTYTYSPCTEFLGVRRTERRVGRPFDGLHGRRRTA